jgi:hypothetical protein
MTWFFQGMGLAALMLIGVAAAACFTSGSSNPSVASAAIAFNPAPVGRRAVLGRVAALIPIAAAPRVALAYSDSINTVTEKSPDKRTLEEKKAGLFSAEVKMNGQYSDPKHPGMARKVTRSGKFVTITGTDEDGKKWTVRGTADGGDLRIDFSPKGGPPDIRATAEPTQIKFADGNIWKKQ